MEYQGWKNRQTWNVALYLQNDEYLYKLAQRYRTYAPLLRALQIRGITHTPDGVSYADKRLSRRELAAMLRDL